MKANDCFYFKECQDKNYNTCISEFLCKRHNSLYGTTSERITCPFLTSGDAYIFCIDYRKKHTYRVVANVFKDGIVDHTVTCATSLTKEETDQFIKENIYIIEEE